MSLLSKKIGIDLGTSTVLSYVKGEAVVVSEPSLTALGRERALRQVIARAQGRTRLFKPEVALSVPAEQTSDERRAVAEAAIAAGARQAWLIDEPLAAAIGAGLPIAERCAGAICVIGAGATQVALIAQWGMLVQRSTAIGGRHIDAAVARWLSSERGVEVDQAEAERVKVAIGSALPIEQPLHTTVEGVDVSSNDVAEAIAEPLRKIALVIRDVVAQVPPEDATDLRKRGVVLSGGGAQLRNLDRFVSMETGLRAMVADHPETSVVRGAGLALESFEVVKRNQSYLR